MDEEQKAEPKIGLVEMLFVGAGIFVLDFVSVIPLVGPLFNFAGTQGYLAMKGMAGTYQLAMLGGNVLTEFLSGIGLGWVPVDLVVFIGIVAVDHFAPQSIAAGLEKAGEVVGAAEGAVGGKAAGAAAGEEAAAAGRAATGTARTAAGEAEAAATTEAAAAGGRAAAGEAAPGEAGGGPGRGGSAESKIEPEALGEERELLGEEGRLQKELFEEPPGETEAAPEPEDKKESEQKKRLRESFEKAGKATKRVQDISEYFPKKEEPASEEEEGEEGQRKAA